MLELCGSWVGLPDKIQAYEIWISDNKAYICMQVCIIILKIICCSSEIQIELSILYFYLLNVVNAHPELGGDVQQNKMLIQRKHLNTADSPSLIVMVFF